MEATTLFCLFLIVNAMRIHKVEELTSHKTKVKLVTSMMAAIFKIWIVNCCFAVLTEALPREGHGHPLDSPGQTARCMGTGEKYGGTLGCG